MEKFNRSGDEYNLAGFEFDEGDPREGGTVGEQLHYYET